MRNLRCLEHADPRNLIIPINLILYSQNSFQIRKKNPVKLKIIGRISRGGKIERPTYRTINNAH